MHVDRDVEIERLFSDPICDGSNLKLVIVSYAEIEIYIYIYKNSSWWTQGKVHVKMHLSGICHVSRELLPGFFTYI